MPKQQSRLNYTQNSLFQPDDNSELNAAVGKNGGPYNYADYSIGYFNAGERLIYSIRDDQTSIDVLIYPLVFIYRHAIELGLKHFVKVAAILTKKNGKANLTHKLQDNWRVSREFLLTLTQIDYAREISIKREEQFGGELSDKLSTSDVIVFVDKVLQDFLKIDPVGEVFRYPESKKEEPYLQEMGIINIPTFASSMLLLGDIFEIWFDHTNIMLYYFDEDE